ncbi:hypothetical protein Cni_G04868 [Canna indica]|uniref:Uncharacterized protein n=1 Tax=Canna indica TaxID=4628 RepID=A0AAQ3JWP2_9LILI|nr:hypothetical protein Cni_G04868 [Canna indica]
MGNGFSRRKKTIKVMKIDGTTLKLKPPAQAAQVLKDYPGYKLLESEEVKRLKHQARPVERDDLLKPGKLYFLVDLPWLAAAHRAPAGRAWSGALHVSAKERLESLKLSRRTMSDLSSSIARRTTAMVDAEETKDGAIRLKMRIPKAQVERLLRESKNAIEAAEKIAELCMMKDGDALKTTIQPAIAAAVEPRRKEVYVIFSLIFGLLQCM